MFVEQHPSIVAYHWPRVYFGCSKHPLPSGNPSVISSKGQLWFSMRVVNPRIDSTDLCFSCEEHNSTCCVCSISCNTNTNNFDNFANHLLFPLPPKKLIILAHLPFVLLFFWGCDTLLSNHQPTWPTIFSLHMTFQSECLAWTQVPLTWTLKLSASEPLKLYTCTTPVKKKQVSHQYGQLFIEFLKGRGLLGNGQKHLVLLDGHFAHLFNYPFMDLMKQNGIAVGCLPPHHPPPPALGWPALCKHQEVVRPRAGGTQPEYTWEKNDQDRNTSEITRNHHQSNDSQYCESLLQKNRSLAMWPWPT